MVDRVGAIMAKTETLHDRLLRASWDEYHDRSTEPEIFYSLLYLEGKDKDPEDRLDRSIIFLLVWNAWDWRTRAPGVDRALEFLPGFLKRNAPAIRSLRKQSLLTLGDADFATIRNLARKLDTGLEFVGSKPDGKVGTIRAPTAWGKLLHFLAPEAILLWDAEVVRNGPLQLGDGPDDFVVLQRWGQRLLLQLDKEKRGSIPRMLIEHRRQTKGHYYEPITKFLDETMYDREAIRQAKALIGRPYT
jgi:hypothetical protein